MENIGKYFQILGLGEDATQQRVKEAYRDSVKAWHPDRFSHDPIFQKKAEKKLQEINHAYEVIQEFFVNPPKFTVSNKSHRKSTYASPDSESNDFTAAAQPERQEEKHDPNIYYSSNIDGSRGNKKNKVKGKLKLGIWSCIWTFCMAIITINSGAIGVGILFIVWFVIACTWRESV